MVTVKIKCPECRADIPVEVPEKACVAVARCKACGKDICTKEGECCVICSYGPQKCREILQLK